MLQRSAAVSVSLYLPLSLCGPLNLTRQPVPLMLALSVCLRINNNKCGKRPWPQKKREEELMLQAVGVESGPDLLELVINGSGTDIVVVVVEFSLLASPSALLLFICNSLRSRHCTLQIYAPHLSWPQLSDTKLQILFTALSALHDLLISYRK